MPRVHGILETALYVADLERAADFYQDLFGFEALVQNDRLVAFSVADRDVLLLFPVGATSAPLPVEGGVIPPHGARGETHFAFAIDADELEAWKEHLQARSVELESSVDWPRGGTSLYFRDPDRNCVELITRGMWRIY